MDIIKFINSRDIAEHLRKIDYKFSPEEAMYLIHASNHNSISEKHKAYKELISLYPNYHFIDRKSAADAAFVNEFNRTYRPECKAQNPFNGENKVSTLTSFLTEYMSRENKLIDEFLYDDKDSVYSASYLSKKEKYWCDYGDILFHTFKECYDSCISDDKENNILSLRIRKKNITSNRTLQAEMTRGGTIRLIEVYIGERDEQFLNASEYMWINIPTPFKFGDILCIKDYEGKDEVFVLADMLTWGGKELYEMGFVNSEQHLPFDKFKRDFAAADRQIKRCEAWGDESDMIGNGYVYSENSMGYSHFFPYTDFEFYRGKFDDDLLPLKAISAFMKDELDYMNFVNAMRIHDARRRLKESEMLKGCFSPEALEKAGLTDKGED